MSLGKSYDGPARYQVPARQYVSFTDAFTAYVTKLQQQVEEVRQVERAYRVVADVLGQLGDDAPDVELKLGDAGITLTSSPGEGELIERSERVATSITRALVDAGLRKATHMPALQCVGWNSWGAWRWPLSLDNPHTGVREHIGSIHWTVHVPSGGLPDLGILSSEEIIKSTTFSYERREAPTHPLVNLRVTDLSIAGAMIGGGGGGGSLLILGQDWSRGAEAGK